MPERAALYRRYRPQTFAAIVGQEHVTRTLRNAIASGQVAHAYLLAGARGTGKTSIARLIAKAVNCRKAKNGEPCDACETCVAIREGRFLDLIEIDAASNRGIDEMRDLRDKVRFAPSQGEYKVYVVDEAHQLTTEAFNALLKTLEEPPPHAIFVLATTESGKIPATIVSRTQRFDLRRISHKSIVAQLQSICTQEELEAEPAALEAIARHAQGSLRDAESILDMVATFADGKIGIGDVDELLGSADWEEVAGLFDALAANDGARGITLVGSLVDDGRDLRLFVRRAIDHARALVLARATGGVSEAMGEGVAAMLRAQAPKFTLDRLARIAKRLVETEQFLRTSEGTPLPLELAILDLTTTAGQEGAGPAGQRGTAKPEPTSGSSGPRSAAPQRPPESRAGVVDLAARRAATAPRPGPTVEARASAPAVDLAQVRGAWAQLVEKTKERSVGKAAHLLKAEPTAVDGALVVISFADEFARALWQDKRRGELEQDLSSILGVGVRVKCVTQPGADVAVVSEDPMLRAAIETFRRPERIMEIE